MLRILKRLQKQMLLRVYKPISEWEEIKANMWGDVENAQKMLELAVSFTSNHALYGKNMMRVIKEWPNSCENALTDPNLNKKAWIGHAACALAIGCPEYITRKAWGYLTDEQRLLANREAERAIAQWVVSYTKSRNLCGKMGEQVLFDWYT
jgi:hypothetical protein